MSESRAVFLSYASQDAEAARHIAESLRASGVEVWFDVEGGLEHGDEWDAKIRRQIKECVLFIPLISANTQSRLEGYFRLEWDMAAERARSIASGVAFILPVVIDDTREPNALVPDRFRAVQWTRLPGGVVPPDVQARFLKLWSHRTGVLKHEAVSGGPTTEDGRRKTEDGADPSQSRKRNPVMLVSAMFALLAIAALAIWQPWGRSESDLPATSPPSEARQLVERARELMGKVNVLPAELSTAAGMLEQAAQLAPNDALVWSTWAQLDLVYVALDFDNTPSRHNAARSHAAQANALDPASRETRFTQARVMRALSGDPATLAAAEKILRPMLTEAPDDGRVLIQLGWVANGQGRMDDAVALFDRAALLPAFAVEATYCKALVLLLRNRFAAADRALDQLLTLAPTHAFALCNKARFSLVWHEDLDAARDYIERIPPPMRVEDMSAFFAHYIYMCLRDYDLAVRAIRAVPRDYLSAQPGPGPSGFYIGEALAAAGKNAAVEIEWRSALATVERRLAEAPSDETLMKFKALLLARLGDHTAGEQTWKAVVELHGDSAWGVLAAPLHIAFLPPDEAIAWLNGLFAEPQYWFIAGDLRHSPVYDPLRANPKFTALVEKMEADPRFSPKAKQRTENGSQRSDSDLPATRSSLLATSNDKSVAVLAFANLSDDKDNEYFSDGISEELLNVLAKVPGLKVTARTSSFHFKGKDTPIPEIAQQLGVAYVIEGSVRKQGDRVRITAQLIKAADGFHVWSDTFTRDLKDIFAVQDEIAGLVAQQLQLKLGVTKPGRQVDPEAYELVLKGRHFWTQRGEANLVIAEEAYRRALEIDANFAEAHAGMADVWMIRAWYRMMDDGGGPAVTEDLERAMDEVQRATELDPSLAEPYATLGAARYIQGRFDEAEAPFVKAFELNPNYATAHHWYAVYSMGIGRFDVCLEEITLATRLDPLAPIPLWTLASVLNNTGAASEAFDAAVRGLQLRPGFMPLLAEKALAAWSLGRRDEAIAAARTIASDHSDNPRWSADAAAIFVLRQSDHLDEAQQLAERVFATVSAQDYRRALALAALGRVDEAFNLSVNLPNTALYFLVASPIWDPVREDPRFPAMVEALGISEIFREGRATLERMRRQNNSGQ